MSFTSINTSASSLVAFSRALDTISDNLSNLNTVGFQRQSSQFRDLFSGGDSSNQQDNVARDLPGVEVTTTNTQFSQGELRETGGSTDVAFDGAGFFVVHQGSRSVLTRDGRFRFDDDGYLVQQAEQAGRVQGLSGDIRLDSTAVSPAVTSTRASLSGNLVAAAQNAQSTVEVIDSSGVRRNLNVQFQLDPEAEGNVWQVQLIDESQNVLGASQLSFQANGSLATGSEPLTVSLSDGFGGSSPIVFDFGDAGEFAGLTSVATGTESNIQVSAVDGQAAGQVQAVRISDQGEVLVTFSNGDERSIDKLSLALVRDASILQRESGTVFSVSVPFASQQAVSLVSVGSSGVGRLVVGSVELANVELSAEFADIIILQRGFQAGSQILNVSNEILQQLYESTAGR